MSLGAVSRETSDKAINTVSKAGSAVAGHSNSMALVFRCVALTSNTSEAKEFWMKLPITSSCEAPTWILLKPLINEFKLPTESNIVEFKLGKASC